MAVACAVRGCGEWLGRFRTQSLVAVACARLHVERACPRTTEFLVCEGALGGMRADGKRYAARVSLVPSGRVVWACALRLRARVLRILA